ncbi:MAG: N-acetylmuramoyl-L-alanine amidase, partial [bacterium]|nr:N-acetylmuramoyl-L-alanine amidase [bacterium]
AGKAYNAPSTFYFFAGGGFVSGTRVTDWDAIPTGTRMILGYREPVTIGRGRGETPWSIAGRVYDRSETLYYLPGHQLLTGDRIKNFNDLPRGTMVFALDRD